MWSSVHPISETRRDLLVLRAKLIGLRAADMFPLCESLRARMLRPVEQFDTGRCRARFDGTHKQHRSSLLYVNRIIYKNPDHISIFSSFRKLSQNVRYFAIMHDIE